MAGFVTAGADARKIKGGRWTVARFFLVSVAFTSAWLAVSSQRECAAGPAARGGCGGAPCAPDRLYEGCECLAPTAAVDYYRKLHGPQVLLQVRQAATQE